MANELLSRTGMSKEQSLVVAGNLSRLRRAKNLSLAALAERAELSEDVVKGVEEATEAPTIRLLWRLANGLGIRFSELIQEEQDSGLSTPTPHTSVRAIARRALLRGADSSGHHTQLYELKLAPNAAATSPAEQPGSSEALLVTTGVLVVYYQGQRVRLSVGESVTVPGDVERFYENPGEQATLAYAKVSPPERP